MKKIERTQLKNLIGGVAPLEEEDGSIEARLYCFGRCDEHEGSWAYTGGVSRIVCIGDVADYCRGGGTCFHC